MIRPSDAKLFEENIAQIRVEVLSRVDENMIIRQAVDLIDDATEANDFGSRAENSHDLHASMSSS